MSMAFLHGLATAAIAGFFVAPAWRRFRKEEAAARKHLADAIAHGRHEPVSIRPWVDMSCMGSGACVEACPEHEVIQVFDGRARLVNGASCVGHGACAEACPMDALELRFGTARRGVDIPDVGPDFQTNVPGLFIAGELGGMGLIANAVKQGAQAAEHLAKQCRAEGRDVDLLIVGAGPAGLSAALRAKQLGLSTVILEQGELAGSIRHYPRHKVITSRGFTFPGCTPVPSGVLTKEELIGMCEAHAAAAGLVIHEGERVTGVTPDGRDGFTVTTPTREWTASRVLLAVGRRGTPRQLEVPGEELEKVRYKLLEPEPFAHRHILVVGGGDSAVEAACTLGEQPGARVTLAYRGEAVRRPRPVNQTLLQEAIDAGRVQLVLQSTVAEIARDRVRLNTANGSDVLPNDDVFVMVGGVLPTKLLTDAGILVRTHYGDRIEGP